MLVDFYKVKSLLEWSSQKIKLDSNAASAGKRIVYRGQVYDCHLGENIGSEETKTRPVLIIQNDKGNKHSPNVIVAPITNSPGTPTVTFPLPSPVPHDTGTDFLTGNVLLANVVTVSKARLGNLLVKKFPYIDQVEEKLIVSMGLLNKFDSLKRQIVAQTKRGDILKKKVEELEKQLEELKKKES